MCIFMCEIYIIRLSQDKISKTVIKKKQALVEIASDFFFQVISQIKIKTFLPFRDEKKNSKTKSDGTHTCLL